MGYLLGVYLSRIGGLVPCPLAGSLAHGSPLSSEPGIYVKKDGLAGWLVFYRLFQGHILKPFALRKCKPCEDKPDTEGCRW